ncbi:hypothetical protein ACSAZL_07785 [Methanosarcina sp. T3]|uniref:hypothetical protein n=1 Tax=Methanosarcina sp. T3 TaxID=3439062 RepID=UPI003F86DBA1
MRKRYGSAPKPENKVAKRAVMCFKCKRVFLSGAVKPLCGKCGSRRIIEYSAVSGSIDALQIRGSIEEMILMIRRHEARLLKFEQMLEIQKSRLDELSKGMKETSLSSTPKKTRPGEHQGPLRMKTEELKPETSQEKRWREWDQSMKQNLKKINSHSLRSVSTRTSKNQM